ncbi:MAG: AtpZ/AtpI family protein [Myxococcales bacterium]|nr:AtpZ/AtpI family protein [Myxococcales bacterium]
MWLQATKFSYLGLFFGVAIVIGYFIGHWLDRRFHTDPWIGMVGLLVGVAAGFRELYRVARQYQREQERDEK